jgi:hypothetical protein
MLLALIVVATALTGLLAGFNVDRLVVQMPAWRRVGVPAWAAYSRHADLGNGLILYPLEAIAGAVATLAAVVVVDLGAGVPRSAALALHVAAIGVVGGLIATVGAAPKMLRLRRIGDQPAELGRAFRGFDRWGAVRFIFQTAAFAANLWALAALR